MTQFTVVSGQLSVAGETGTGKSVIRAKHLYVEGYKTGEFAGLYEYKNRGGVAFAREGVLQADGKAANVHVHADQKV